MLPEPKIEHQSQQVNRAVLNNIKVAQCMPDAVQSRQILVPEEPGEDFWLG